VITCNRCGELAQAGLANCRRCGMSLYSANQGGADSQKDVRERSELPTWLESLRVNERPNSPTSGQPFFSTADLIDEGALPSWMRPENAEMMEKGNSGKYPAWRPASIPAPDTDKGTIPPKGFPARSLIDEQSLPSWVQGNQHNIQATTGAMPVTPDSQGNFSAASLIQPDDLPDWMKSLPQSSHLPVPPNNVWRGERPSTSQVRINSYTPNAANSNSNPLPQRFSAQEQVDPRATPHWMSGQPGQQAGYPPTAPPQGEQSGLPASTLLDVNSLPAWLREEEHMQSQPGQMQAYSPGHSGQIPGGNNLTGASLIDANALPDWLRSYEAQQQAGMPPMANIRPLSNGPSPRVENVRVPSRPRGEMAAHEQSEVAANVFSSVLGVASSAPYFPSAAPGSQWNAPSQGFQGGQPQPPAGTQWNAPSQPSGFAGVPPAQGYNAGYQGGQQGAYPAGGYAGYAGPGGFPAGVQSGMAQQPPVSGSGMLGEPSMTGQQSKTNASGSKPAKRGFIETIRSWFS
jgi:hypothetical protein